MFGFGQKMPAEAVPEGVTGSTTGRAYSTDRVGPHSALPAAGRTFDVTPHHELRAGGGVRFNVENVSPASKEDHHKQVLPSATLRKRRLTEAKAHYESDDREGFGYQVKFTPMRLEAESRCPEGLIHAGSDAFLVACLTAFARHLPLALNPDHIWAVIAYGFAKHVDKNAEALRKNFVQHEGKKRLLVEVDHFTMSGGVEGAGTPAESWETDVFPSFSKQIREHIGAPVHDAIAGAFSTTDSVSQAAHEIVLMSAMKHYFSYGMCTMCGIPNISLLGARDDWVAIRARAEHLGSLMMPDFASRWLGVLLPVLDEFIAAYDGKVGHGFWQSMVKLRNTGGGSGSYSFISGWIQLLYPYLASGQENQLMRPWQEMYFSGPELSDFPAISSSAPVDWEYFGTAHNLHFHAGFAGVVQDPADGAVSPVLGWHVTHDPPQEPAARLTQIEEEITALMAGHAGEEHKGPWFERVTVLQVEQAKLSVVIEATERQVQISKLQQDQRNRELSQEVRQNAQKELVGLQAQQQKAVQAIA